MPTRPTDVRPLQATLYFLPVRTRVPLKFGTRALTAVTLARVSLDVATADGRTVRGWGETPLSVQWVWPSAVPYEERHAALKDFTRRLAAAWSDAGDDLTGHPLEVGDAFLSRRLPALLERFNAGRAGAEPMPWLAALVCCAPFDVALHDAYGYAAGRPVYETYAPPYLTSDLAAFLTPAAGTDVDFAGRYPADYLVPAPASLPAWHLVGGKD